jgi:hypothetical protein
METPSLYIFPELYGGIFSCLISLSFTSRFSAPLFDSESYLYAFGRPVVLLNV